jgi:3-oxoacyl-[acyl-carrier-protein] synthase II
MAAPPHRVAITGIGALTPIGHGRAGLWQGVRRGQPAVRTVTRFDPNLFRARCAAEIDGFEPIEYMEPKRARRLDRFSQLAVAAAIQAADDAGLCVERCPDDVGCTLGTALGGVAFAEQQHDAYVRRGPAGVSPALALSVFGAAGSSNVAIELGLRGPSGANSNSCASGLMAIGEAFQLIRAGRATAMLAGGVEAPLAPLTFGSFALIKAMSTTTEHQPRHASRPFDARRDGFVMAEGAAMLVLERLDHAQARDARVLAEVRGYGTTNDGYHMLAPRPDGQDAARAIDLALQDASLHAEDVDYVNAHASATPIGDRAEVRALQAALGAHAARVPVSGTKGLYGHPLGASGAIETAISALAIHHGFLPGTTNLERPDDDNPLRLLPPCGESCQPRVVLNNAFGFGGINAALVLSAP